MDPAPRVRPGRQQDVRAIARVHARSWQETYRGLMADAVLDDPGQVAHRARLWATVFTDRRYVLHRTAVAEHGAEVVGIALAGPPDPPDAPGTWELYSLYVLRDFHGSGIADALLDEVVGDRGPTVLWVAERNPRAQAFYRKHGYAPDGETAEHDGGFPIVRMIHP